MPKSKPPTDISVFAPCTDVISIDSYASLVLTRRAKLHRSQATHIYLDNARFKELSHFVRIYGLCVSYFNRNKELLIHTLIVVPVSVNRHWMHVV